MWVSVLNAARLQGFQLWPRAQVDRGRHVPATLAYTKSGWRAERVSAKATAGVPSSPGTCRVRRPRPGIGVRRHMVDSANRDQRRAGDSPLAAACSPVAWDWSRGVMVELVQLAEVGGGGSKAEERRHVWACPGAVGRAAVADRVQVLALTPVDRPAECVSVECGDAQRRCLASESSTLLTVNPGRRMKCGLGPRRSSRVT